MIWVTFAFGKTLEGRLSRHFRKALLNARDRNVDDLRAKTLQWDQPSRLVSFLWNLRNGFYRDLWHGPLCNSLASSLLHGLTWNDPPSSAIGFWK